MLRAIDMSAALDKRVFYLAVRRAKVSTELHLDSQGGHGFGMRQRGQPILAWPNHCLDWMREEEFLKSAAKIETPERSQRRWGDMINRYQNDDSWFVEIRSNSTLQQLIHEKYRCRAQLAASFLKSQ